MILTFISANKFVRITDSLKQCNLYNEDLVFPPVQAKPGHETTEGSMS